MKILIFDLQITGHHSEYIEHLIDYIDLQSSNEYVFVVNPKLKDNFPNIHIKGANKSNILWVFIGNDELNLILGSNVILRSLREVEIIKKYASIYKIDHVLAMYFNTLQIGMGINKKLNFTISGILFLQFTRMRKKSVSERFKYLRKYFVTNLYSRNKSIKYIYILNDNKAVQKFNDLFHTSIFKMLPDPVPQIEEEAHFNLKEYFQIENKRSVLLMFGALSERKGTIESIEALNFINEEDLKKISLLIVGSASDSFHLKISAAISQIQKKSLNASIYYYRDFVSNSRMKSIFNQSDIILLPYKNAEASSGILGHAIASKKIVIASGNGLIKDIVEENNLGLLVNPITAMEIGNKISEVLGIYKTYNIKSLSYISSHSPEKFVEILF